MSGAAAAAPEGSPRDCSRVRQHSARSQRKQCTRHHPPPGHLPHASEETAQRQRDRHAQRKSLQSQRHTCHQPHHAAGAHTQIHRCRHRHQPRRRHAKVYIRQHHPRAAAQEHQQQIPNRQSAFKRLETSSAADALYRAAHDRRGERSQQNGADAKEQRRRRPLPHADDCPPAAAPSPSQSAGTRRFFCLSTCGESSTSTAPMSSSQRVVSPQSSRIKNAAAMPSDTGYDIIPQDAAAMPYAAHAPVDTPHMSENASANPGAAPSRILPACRRIFRPVPLFVCAPPRCPCRLLLPCQHFGHACPLPCRRES